jgi:hypothetical protein
MPELGSSGGAASSSPDLSPVYRTLYQQIGRLAAGSGAGLYIPAATTSPANSPYTMAANPETFEWIYLDDADLAVAGKTAKLRIRAQVATNDTAPAVTFAFGLYPVTSTTCAASQIELTAGSIVGTAATIATPAALSIVSAVSADFDVPADGPYLIGVLTSGGATAANSSEALVAQLQARYV